MARPGRKPGQATWLYSVWRNSDDQLIALDCTAKRCCEVMHVSSQYFYAMQCKSRREKAPYTIKRIKADELNQEEYE